MQVLLVIGIATKQQIQSDQNHTAAVINISGYFFLLLYPTLEEEHCVTAGDSSIHQPLHCYVMWWLLQDGRTPR